MSATTRVSKKRKFVADGVMFAEINELLGKVRGLISSSWGREFTRRARCTAGRLITHALPPLASLSRRS